MTRIGIAITTKDRHEVALDALRAHVEYWPTPAHHRPGVGIPGHPGTSPVHFVVIDDGSRADFRLWLQRHHLREYEQWAPWMTFVRHAQPWGIARSKNHGIAALMAMGCTDLFLFDDDAHPIRVDWALPYLAHPEGHLQFNYATGNDHDVALVELYRDADTIAYHASRGVLLYYTAEVIAALGGMDRRYEYGFEHVELSERIHSAGFTSWVAQSPRHGFLGDDPMIEALDETEAVDSTISARQRREHTTANLAWLAVHQGRTDFVSYTEPADTVLTCLFTGIEDPGEPARPREPWDASAEYAENLLTSLGHRAAGPTDWAIPVTVLHNEALDDTGGRDHLFQLVSIDSVTEALTVYVQRWISIRRHLITRPAIEKLWIVDCADVEFLQRGPDKPDPFAEIAPATLYVGIEDKLAGDAWMIAHHPASRPWLTRHSRRPLYNAGVLGGDRDTVLQFIAHLLAAYRRAIVAGENNEVGDMGYVQQAIAAMTVPVVSGPQITSVFKAYQYDNVSALFRHK